MSGMPNFGVAPGFLLILVLFFLSNKPRTPVGLSAHFGRWETSAPGTVRAGSTLAVYIDGMGHFFVNGKPVAREMLPISLKEELSHHATTTIYFEAADNSGYGQCIYAIDTIRGLGADLILITPGMRDEWKRTAHR